MTTKLEPKVFLSQPHMSGHELKYIEQAFQDNWIAPLGPNVTEFENTVVNYLAEKNLYAIAMSSGTAAIHIALKLLGIKAGDEVFCSSATFAATANPIAYEKAIPVFIDSESTTWNICPDSLLKAIQSKKKKNQKIPKALIAVDLFGQSANYEKIETICKEHGIALIEDAAEALGSTYKGKKCGTFGEFGILSFNGNKIITTSGGGMLITHNKQQAEKALFLITQARDKAPYYLHSEIGYNYRLSNICAGIGRGQMEVIDERVKARRQIFENYKLLLKDTPLIFKSDEPGYYSNRWLSTVLLPENYKTSAAHIINELNTYNIECRHIWKALHTQPVFKNCEFFSVQEKTVAENIFELGFCLPSTSSLSLETQTLVCDSIVNLLNKM